MGPAVGDNYESETRSLVQVNITDEEAATVVFTLMGVPS